MNMMCRETILKKVLADEQVKTFFHKLRRVEKKPLHENLRKFLLMYQIR